MQEKGRKKNQEKRIILAFLREEAGILLWVVFFIGIFWLLCFLEDIPQDVTIYTLQLASFTGIAVLIVRFIRYRKRCKTLELLTKDPRDKIEAFPNPDTLSEKLYRQIIGQYERELRKEEQQMDDRYREMVEYYTMWTHQIKTPIAAMRLHLQAADTPENHMLLEDLQRIEQYVEMVLCYLRLDSDSTDYLFVQCDLDSIVRQAVRRFSAQFIHRKIRLEYEPLDCQVLTDEKWLLFVLEQVLSNALKYTPSGGTVSIFLEEPKTLCIRDTGIGIAAEDLPRIFEKGFTGCNGRTDKKASGIGLYLCRRICRNLNHTITAESQAEQGTTIRIGMFRETRGIE